MVGQAGTLVSLLWCAYCVTQAAANGAEETTLTAPIAIGASCAAVVSTVGFAAGAYVEFKEGITIEDHWVKNVFNTSDCTGTPLLTGRRLQAGAPGHSLQTAEPFASAFSENTTVLLASAPVVGQTCFPGDATVNVFGLGATHVASLSVGDRVLAESGEFEPVLSFLHKVLGAHESVTVVHSQGTFRASANHIVFVFSEAGVRGDMAVSALRPGDQLLVQIAVGEEMPSQILATSRGSTSAGMYAPFTSSGSLVVDGVIASNYGAPSSRVSLPHGAAHAAFFGLRLFHYLDLGIAPKLDAVLLPFANMMLQQKYAN